MPLGQIKTLTDRGFGFIASNDGADVFFHMSTLESGSQFDMLREGQPVEYEADSGDRGPRATMVRIVEAGAAAPAAAPAETDDYSDLPSALLEAKFKLKLFREEEVNLETAFMELTKGLVQ